MAPIVVGVNNENVIMRYATFPKVPDDKLRGVVTMQAQDFIPVPVSELGLDFVVIDETTDDDDQPALNVLLIGARKLMLDNLIQNIEESKLEVVDIDSSFLAWCRVAIEETSEDEVFGFLCLTDDVLDFVAVADKEIKIGTVYKMTIKVNEYGGKMQVVITAINDILDGEVELTDFFRSAPMKEAELRSCINEYIRKITNKTLKELVVYLIKQVEKKYFTYPAAVTMHHNFLQGLVYHTYSMLRLADRVIENYPVINKSLLYTGVLLHDIGKTKELSAKVSPVYSLDGVLLGHIVIGMNMISVKAKELGYEETEEVKMLLHMIAAHHGELEFGSPKEPQTMEALALHLIDLMDSK
jgi:putative nucleotidyltransferase with HDIG domain